MLKSRRALINLNWLRISSEIFQETKKLLSLALVCQLLHKSGQAYSAIGLLAHFVTACL
jgi:hypothetical protein